MISFFETLRARFHFWRRLNNLGLQLPPHDISFLKFNGSTTPVYCAQIVVLSPNDNEPVTFTGLGTTDFCLAVDKAISEFLEATLFWRHHLSWMRGRSGFATGRNLEEATELSFRELVERDSFLMHFLCPDLKSTTLNTISL